MRRLALIFSFFASAIQAHELWIEPITFQVGADTIVKANVVNGEKFEGSALSYVPRNFERFVAVNGGKFSNVEGRLGDRPAMALQPLGEGLHVIAYQSVISTLNYAEWEKFQRFVDHKDLGDVLDAHTARNLATSDFDEAYSRFSKSLIGIGHSEGSDRRLGLLTEIVALDNPYTIDQIGEIRLQLYYQQEVRADEQIEVFEKAPDGTVEISFYRTDAEGIAKITVKPGHSYMADAVVLREPSQQLSEQNGAVWETLWANLTWGIPE